MNVNAWNKITIPTGEYTTRDALAAAVKVGLEVLFNDRPDGKWNNTAKRLKITTGSTMSTMDESACPVRADGYFVS
eukprot:6189377-Pleurochrysis_carterae.AAC.2